MRANWNGSKWLRPEKRLAIYMRDNWLCGYCNKDLHNVKAKLRTLDHILPVALGGTNEASNLVTCCKRCNDSKRDTTLFNLLCPLRTNDLLRVLRQSQKPLDVLAAKRILKGDL